MDNLPSNFYFWEFDLKAKLLRPVRETGKEPPKGNFPRMQKVQQYQAQQIPESYCIAVLQGNSKTTKKNGYTEHLGRLYSRSWGSSKSAETLMHKLGRKAVMSSYFKEHMGF